MANITIDGQKTEAQDGTSILKAAIAAEIYIPHLCGHPQLDASSEVQSMEEIHVGGVVHKGDAGVSSEGCNLCLVQIEGRDGFHKSCQTLIEDGMAITTDSAELQKARKDNLYMLCRPRESDRSLRLVERRTFGARCHCRAPEKRSSD